MRLFHWRKGLKRFKRSRRGSAAVEFAMLALPFFLMTFGMAETAMIGLSQTSLDYAVNETARQIRTGEAQLEGVTYGEIKDELCDEMSSFVFLECPGNLFLDVNRFNSFVAAAAGNDMPTQNGNFDPSGFGFNPGNASDIVVVRAYYRWKILTPMFEPFFSNVSGGERILVSTMMFRNEPYQ